MTDPIVDEVRAIRARIAAECEYDLDRIADSSKAAAGRVPGLTYVSVEDVQQAQLEAEALATAAAHGR